MEWIEITASTEHEALDRALDELGVHRDEAEWEVVEVQKARLGGLLGRNEARVRARIKPVSREKPQTRRDRGNRSGGRGRRSGGGSSKSGGGKSGGGKSGGGKSGGGGSGGNGGGRGGRKQESKKNTGGSGRSRAADRSDSRDSDGKDSLQKSGGRGGGRSRRGRSGGGGGSAKTTREGNGRGDNNPDGKARQGRRQGATVSDGEERDEETVPIDEQAEIAEDFIEGLADAFEVDADIDVDADDEDWTLQISVEGGELGLLVGPGGATITAIEELTRTVLQRRTGGHAARVRVDVGGYKARRREALENFSRDLIDKVKESGRSHELEPMNAADRKTVHGVAADDDGVTTSSEGEEPRRRVVIHPA